MVQYPQITIMIHIYRMKDKNHMVISTDAEIALDKIQHPFMIKTLNKVGIKEICLTIIQAIYDKYTYSMVKNSRLFLEDQEQSKDAHSHYFSST